MKPERRTIQEQVGTSLNASVLRSGRPDVETPLTRVAALGAAALVVHHGADRGERGLAQVVADPRHRVAGQDRIAAQLGSVLVHIRFGGQYGEIAAAVRLFAEWMAFRGRFNAYEDRAVLLPRLAARALHEWLSDRCPRCGGSGWMEVTGDGTLVRGRGRQARNASFRHCPSKNGCGGTGRPMPSHTSRRLALEITRERYDNERWGAHVQAAIAWLDRNVAGRITRSLTAQLDRSKKNAL